MAKKQTIILTHGKLAPENVSINKGEVLVQHAEAAKDAALWTVLDDESTKVAFPSKEWVDVRISELENEKTQEAIADLDERLTAAEGDIKDLQAEDAQIRLDYADADATLKSGYETADAALKAAYEAADTAIRGEFADADEALEEKININTAAITALQGEDTKIRQEFANADTEIRQEFAAADTKVREDFATADAALKAEYEGLINDLDERVGANADAIADLVAEDAQIRIDYAAADADVVAGYEAADAQIRLDYADADATLKSGYETADAALDERVGANADAIAALQTADTNMEAAYKAADDKVREDFADADTQIRKDFADADTQIRKDFADADSDINERIDVIVGEDANMSMREVAVDELAKQLVPEGAKEALDTLEEIAAWIQQHPEDAAAMNAAIEQNKNDIAANKKASDDAESALNERLTTAEGEIDALQAADTAMEAAYKAADDVVRGEFKAADTAMEAAYKAADSALETAYKAADSALDERVTANANAIKDLQAADTAMEAAYKAADDVVRGEFAAADTAMETAYKAADKAIEDAYKAADSALDEKIVEIQSNYVKEVVANGKSYKPTENVLDLSEMVIDGGEY